MFDNIPIATILFFGFGLLLSSVAFLYVPRNRKPTAGMAWLLVIFLIPYIGWMLFLLLGTNKLPKNRRNSQLVLDRIIDNRVGQLGDEMVNSVPSKYRAIATLATSLGHLPPLYGDATDFLTDYEASFKKIVKDIRKAKASVYLEYFILIKDESTKELFEALTDAAQRGVEVRVLYDWWGTRKLRGARQTIKYMNTHGITSRAMLPLQLSFRDYLRIDLRNHRKLIIIDHDTGYVGSQNIIKRTYGRRDAILYDELVVRLKGTVINALKALFAYDWSVESKDTLQHTLNETLTPHNKPGKSLLQILPSGPSYNDENNLKVFTLAINRAEDEIFIANSYFVPSESLLSAIVTAAKRGVRVRMINSEAMDQWMVGHAQRSYYEELLQAGVEIYLYQKPELLHSKFILVDNEIGFVGSSNMDIRSFELNQELSLILYTRHDVHKLVKIRNHYLSRSNKIMLEAWRKRPMRIQLLDSIARLTANLQ